MPNKNGQILARLVSFAQDRVGEKWGWQKRFADLLGISAPQLNNILAGRSPVGPGIRERLASKGCDIEWLMTGKNTQTKEELAQFVRTHPGSYIPENLPEKTRKQIKLLIEEISKLEPGEVEKAREIIRTIFNTKKGK